jgi:hypothetical protein
MFLNHYLPDEDVVVVVEVDADEQAAVERIAVQLEERNADWQQDDGRELVHRNRDLLINTILKLLKIQFVDETKIANDFPEEM